MPSPFADLYAGIVDDVVAGLAVRAADVRGDAVAGAHAAIEGIVGVLLGEAERTSGPFLQDHVFAYKGSIRRVIGGPVLEMFDAVIHGLRDVRIQAGEGA